ncbi:MAG: MMPL family transporter, partial [Frankiaceae bacterium]|nr:MMPL family transporter [Frankiaceae bacterium]
MATYLYRLAKFSYRRRRLVLAIWLLILVGLGGAAITLKGPSNDQFSIPGIESQQAINLLNAKFPSAAAGGATAQAVFVAPAGQRIDSGDRAAAVAAFAAEVGAAPHVAAVTPPAQAPTSGDGRTTFLRITYDVQSNLLTAADQDRVWAAVRTARAAGLNVQAEGNALQIHSGTGSTEVMGFLVGAIVLAITFGSLVAAGLPLLTALIGVAVGMSGVLAVSHWVQLSSTAPILALMLGLAVGIDYALFILSRYRHELLSGRDGPEAIGRAGGTAGSAVVF